MTPPLPEPASGLNAAVAAELRAEMARQQVTARELSVRAEIPYSTLRRYLGAERHIDVTVLFALAQGLGVEVAKVVAAAAERLGRVDIGWAQVEVAESTPMAARRTGRKPSLAEDDE